MRVEAGTPGAAVQAAAAVMVLVRGSQEDLSALGPVAGSQRVDRLRTQLREGARADRARALSAILTSVAMDLSDWGLR